MNNQEFNKRSPLKPTIAWFRQDLRLEDNPALLAAVIRKAPIVPVYIWSEGDEWAPGAASKVWLYQSLSALNTELEEFGSRLIIRTGEALKTLAILISETEAGALFWNRRYEPEEIILGKKIKENFALMHPDLIIKSFNGSLLYEPWEILQKNGKPYQVYTAFWHACSQYGELREPTDKPRTLISPKQWPPSLKVEDLKLLPTLNWADDIKKNWSPGSAAAKMRLAKFVRQGLAEYSTGRNRPDLNLVSGLSPYLHLGQLSPHQIYHSVKMAIDKSKDKNFLLSAQIYLKELVWREFAHYLLFHFPHTPTEPLRPQYKKFPWRSNKAYLRAWQQGNTGYPIVDAGMRQLWQIGWMHNRVRMIVASFLVKDLLISWQSGAQWFWDTLVDADLANNTLGWQWTAGCGADAAPYFRVFNPIIQGQKFDPQGTYIKQFVPELRNLPTEYLHAPWLASAEVLSVAKLELGKDYPKPIVDHSQARIRALDAWRQIKQDGISQVGAKKNDKK